MRVRLSRELNLTRLLHFCLGSKLRTLFFIVYLERKIRDAISLPSSTGFIMNETFIPLPRSRFPADVPLLPAIEYDFRGLNDFPTRHGIMSSGLDELNHRSAESSASFVQSWLFFGLLADLTGTLVDRDHVLHPGPRQPIPEFYTLVYPPTFQHNELGLRMTSSSEESNVESLYQKLCDTVRVGIDNVERIDRLVVAERHPMPHV